MWCTARLTTEGCQSAGGNTETELGCRGEQCIALGGEVCCIFYLFVVLDCLVNGRFLLINSDILIVERLLAFIDLDCVGSIHSDGLLSTVLSSMHMR